MEGQSTSSDCSSSRDACKEMAVVSGGTARDFSSTPGTHLPSGATVVAKNQPEHTVFQTALTPMAGSFTSRHPEDYATLSG
jgi:hypothetical protein